jgi:copper chaperone
MAEQVLLVDGMHCGGCTSSVERALRAIAGVEQVQVELESGRVTVSGAGPLSREVLADAIHGLGFDVRPA